MGSDAFLYNSVPNDSATEGTETTENDMANSLAERMGALVIDLVKAKSSMEAIVFRDNSVFSVNSVAKKD